MKRIATHRAPDADALAALWLARRFVFAGEEAQIVFVSRSWTPASRQQFSCVVDVGRAHDAARLLFDHKPPALADRNASCAARLVWEYLLAQGQAVEHLEPLVLAVHEGDRRPPRAASAALTRSRRNGFHALVSRLRREGAGDEAMAAEAAAWLDGYEFARREAAQVLEAAPSRHPEAQG